ncbi:ABC transporter ATP-binding protein [Anaerocolumna chitinilytica]|uniref:Spermidine/putrescine import ATP-binding protein PotA n=1 Tax=Anaerocolumna chitinilytica TaxID=1727145 RepID=A0A7I8DTG0_9FIRM|nr:ABC transporter ATP-binding protein [Anaerocolumna chitinilytica]BCK00605.1 spermidine/putrescine import ATP-binding protein PotA [Anaerocolumna chitinilytica]
MTGDRNRKAIVEIRNVNKIYADNHVVHDLKLEIYEGEFLTMLGPSGCGKTTILRMIGGFEETTSGEILIEGENVEEKEPFQRNVNTVFQSYALFPHLTIFKNIAYGLKMKKVPKEEIKKRVQEMLELVQLNGYDKRYPSQLSGGQKQRVAIARALINNPKVLLLDEPLGALDLKLRKEMQLELKNLQKKLGITFVYVTHDQEEALTMSDRIAVMNQGYLDQLDTPEGIYEKPKTKFVADFIGESNIFEATVKKSGSTQIVLGLEVGEVLAQAEKEVSLSEMEMVHICVRPEKMLFSKEEKEGFHLCGRVKEQIYVGNIIKSNVILANGQVVKISRMDIDDVPRIGEVVNLYWNLDDVVIMKSREYLIHNVIENVKLGGD